MNDNKQTSKNERAASIMGLRNKGEAASFVFEPGELGYVCPVCKHKEDFEREDPTLEWSEYNGFVWCSICNMDIPSCCCKMFPEPNITSKPLPLRLRVAEMTRIFLDTVESAKHVSGGKKEG